MSVPVALKFWLLPVPSIERYAVMQWFPCLSLGPALDDDLTRVIRGANATGMRAIRGI